MKWTDRREEVLEAMKNHSSLSDLAKHFDISYERMRQVLFKLELVSPYKKEKRYDPKYVSELVMKTGCTPSSILRRLRLFYAGNLSKEALEAPHNWKHLVPTCEDIEMFRKLFLRGDSLKDISNKTGFSVESVTKHLRYLGEDTVKNHYKDRIHSIATKRDDVESLLRQGATIEDVMGVMNASRVTVTKYLKKWGLK